MIPSNVSEKPVGIEGKWEIHTVRVPLITWSAMNLSAKLKYVYHISWYTYGILLFFGPGHPDNLPTKRSSGQKGHWKMNGCKTKQVNVYRIKCRLLFIKSPKGLKSHLAGMKDQQDFLLVDDEFGHQKKLQVSAETLKPTIERNGGLYTKRTFKVYISIHAKRLGTQWVTWLSQWGASQIRVRYSQIGSFPQPPPPVPTNMTQPAPLSLILFYGFFYPWTLESPRSPEVLLKF